MTHKRSQILRTIKRKGIACQNYRIESRLAGDKPKSEGGPFSSKPGNDVLNLFFHNSGVAGPIQETSIAPLPVHNFALTRIFSQLLGAICFPTFASHDLVAAATGVPLHRAVETEHNPCCGARAGGLTESTKKPDCVS